MSGRHFYLRQESSFNNDDDDDELHYPKTTVKATSAEVNVEVEDEADKDEDSEFLHDVPYSASSVDRSSIGSIPWADDAIKKNKLDWERVERMLCGAEELPMAEEPELCNEIIDWQHKFPKLLGRKAPILKQSSYESSRGADIQLIYSGDNDSISNLSLNSLDDDNGLHDEDDEEEDGFLTPIASRVQSNEMAQQPTTRYTPLRRPVNDLTKMLDRDLHITPVTLRQRVLTSAGRRQSPSATHPTQFLVTATAAGTAPHTQQTTANSATAVRSRLRMPPILNVLDTNRRFRGLLNNNRSFVQLTQVQQQQQQQQQQQHRQQQHQRRYHQPQIKSAAITHATSAERRQPLYMNGNRSAAWHIPIAAATFSHRFLNNRNAIVLPAINHQPVHDFNHSSSTPHATTTTTASLSNSSGEHKLNASLQPHQHFNVNSSSSLSSGQARTGGKYTSGRQYNYALQQHYHNGAASGVVGLNHANLTTNSTTSPSTGRSISAAVHHARSDYLTSAFYIPYSASKFKAFQSDLRR